MASFFHELFQYADTHLFFGKNLYHKSYIWKESFLHELLQYAYSYLLKNASQILHLKSFFPAWFNMSFQLEVKKFRVLFQSWTDLHDLCLKSMHYNCYIWILEISDHHVFVFALDSEGSHFIPFWKKFLQSQKKGYILQK